MRFLLIISLCIISGTCRADKWAQTVNIKLENAAFAPTMKFLRKKYRINIALRDKKPQLDKMPVITLDFQDVPLFTLVQFICHSAGVKYSLEDELLIAGKNVEMKKPLRLDKVKTDSLADIPWGTSMNFTRSYYFPVGYTKPKIITSGNRVMIIGSKPIFKKAWSGTRWDARYKKTRTKKAAVAKPKKNENPVMLAALKNISLPKTEFNAVAIDKVFEFLRNESRNKDRYRKVINFYLTPEAREAVGDQKFSMILPPLPLGKVVKYLARYYNLQYYATRFVVVFHLAKQAKDN